MAEEKIIKHGSSVQDEIISGVVAITDVIKTTLGPQGKSVAISNQYSDSPEVSRDGAYVAKSISFKDPNKNMGAMFVKNASVKTADLGGDASSTTAILIKEMVLKGQKALSTGANVNEIRSGMLKARAWVSKYILENSIEVGENLDLIREVATISGNNDPEVGNLVVECMGKVGVNGVITADNSPSIDTSVETVLGMKIDRGYASPNFITNQGESSCCLENPYVLVIGSKLSSVQQMIPILEPMSREGRPFLIICDDIDDNVLSFLILNNLQGTIRCCVVKGIDFGDSRKNLEADIAVATGAEFITPELGREVSGMTVEDLGSASKVIVTRDSCIIYEGAGNPDNIKARVDIIKQRLQDPGISDYDKTKFTKRLANLAGGIGVIKVGAANDTERQNLKQTVEDAILASKSAIEEGVSIGGGLTYYEASLKILKDKGFWKSLQGDEQDGAMIVIKSLPIILKTIAENSGVSGDVVLEKIKSSKPGIGFNAKTRKYSDLLKDGVLDASKVLRLALENSIAAASMILLIDCTVTEEPQEENKDVINNR